MAQGKVVHVSNEVHRKVRKFCLTYNLVMSTWVDDVLLLALEAAKEVDITGWVPKEPINMPEVTIYPESNEGLK